MDLLQHERVFYVDIIPQHPRTLLVPFNITDTKKWMSFQAFKKNISVRPFMPRDALLLQRRQADRAAQILQRINGEGDDGSKVLSPAALTQSPGSLMMGSPLRKRQKPVLRDRSSSVSSQHSLRDRAGSTGSELGTMLSPNRTPLASNRRSVTGKPYQMLVPLMFRVSEVIRRVAEELEVDERHIALFFVQQGASGNKAWLRRRFEAYPSSLANCGQSTVKDTLEEQKVSLKVTAKYCVFYRINPYCTQSEQDRILFRTVDFVLTDERIRYWRRLFLEHLRQSGTAARTIDLTDDRLLTSRPSTPVRLAEAEMEVVEVSAEAAAVAQETGAKRMRADSDIRSASVPQLSQTPGSQHSQRAASIVWPAPLGEYDGREDAVITFRAATDTLFCAITENLRDLAGIPKNFAELEALKLPVGEPSGAASVATAVQPLLLVDSTRRAICLQNFATCSDNLRLENEVISPAFPLLVTAIRHNVVDEIQYASLSVSKVMDSL